MTVHASHRGIRYEIEEIRSGEWQWSFLPPTGARRAGRLMGEHEWAITVARRAIEVWHLMNREPPVRTGALSEGRAPV
jgi:hypothetical protein